MSSNLPSSGRRKRRFARFAPRLTSKAGSYDCIGPFRPPLMSNVKPMPSYVWCCFACGSSNAPAAAACAVCQCPPRATVAQLEQFRSALLSRQTSLAPQATHLHEPPEISALAVFSPVLWVLTLGLWPWQWPEQRTAARRGPHEV